MSTDGIEKNVAKSAVVVSERAGQSGSPAVALASGVWSTVNSVRRVLQRQLSAPERLAARVVSIGNIQAGGSGKTPIVAWVANEAHRRELQVAILTRGYRGALERTGGVIVPGQRNVSALEVGDEPALLHILAPYAYIGIGANRAKQFYRLLDKINRPGFRFDLVLLDDGFQNHQIKKDLELVTLTSQGPTERVYREWPSALVDADACIWTKGQTQPDAHGRRLFRACFELAPAPAPASKVWLVTGVGDPESVAQAMRERGYVIDKHFSFDDHARYDAAQVREILSSARQAGARVVTTGKDAVKWQALGILAHEFARVEPTVHLETPSEEAQFWALVFG